MNANLNLYHENPLFYTYLFNDFLFYIWYECMVCSIDSPANTRPSPNGGFMLAHRVRRVDPTSNQTSGQCQKFAIVKGPSPGCSYQKIGDFILAP